MAQAHADSITPSPADASPKVQRQELSLDEAIALYYGEWVLMKITEHDEHSEPVRGYVIAHSPKRSDLTEALKAEPPRPEGSPYQPYYPFYALPFVHVGETFEQAVERFTAQRAAAQRGRRAGQP